MNVRQIRRIIRHQIDNDQDSAPESFSDTNNWLNCNGDQDNPNDSEDGCAADNASDIERDDAIEHLEIAEPRNVIAAPTDPRLIRPTQQSTRQVENALVMVNTTETRRQNGMKR
jgi:hypothetical protein